MMFGNYKKFAAGLVLVLCAFIAKAQDSGSPWNFPDFSAIQISGGERRPLPMKVYWSGESLRIEKTPALADLFSSANGKVYRLTVYPDKSRQCVVMTSQQAKMLPSPLQLLQGTNVKRTPAGTETVEGHSCKVELVSVTRDGEIIESKVWEAEDLKGVPVKIESQVDHRKFTAVYRDIAFGALDQAIFTPPEKCTPFEKMGQVVENKTIK
jgi:hypothetical protein